MSIKEKLDHLKLKEGILVRKKIEPNEVEKYQAEGYTVVKTSPLSNYDFDYIIVPDQIITDKEIDELLKFRMSNNIKIIKYCVIFFTVLTSISLFCGLIRILQNL